MQNLIAELEQTLALLRVEEEEERRQYLEKVVNTPLPERIKKGTTWYPVKIAGQAFGPGDTLLVDLEPVMSSQRQQLFGPGQVVAAFRNHPGNKNISLTGVVARARPERITVAFSATHLPDWLYEGNVGVDAFYDDSSFRDMEGAMQAVIQAEPGSRLAELRAILLGAEPATFRSLHDFSKTSKLNRSQHDAVNAALAANDAMLILGPPGTGKTTTLVEAVSQVLLTEARTLVTAPSNTAVDLLAERLAEAGHKVLRLGHPVRVSGPIQQLTLDYQLSAHPLYSELKQMRRRAESAQKQAAKYKRNFGQRERAGRQENYAEADALKKDANKLERYILADVVDETTVFAATLTGCASQWLKDITFDTVFIDEAAQALEPACWIALRKAKRVIFAGDPFQLPPTVKSKVAAEAGLGLSLAEKFYTRQLQLGNQLTSHMLQVQYRMHETIMAFSGDYFYQGALIADASVRSKTLKLAEPRPVTFIDTAGCGYTEVLNEETRSTYNPGEAALLVAHLKNLLLTQPQPVTREEYWDRLDENPYSVAVIAPYFQQVELLRRLTGDDPDLAPYQKQIAVRTVDGFQGQERDIVYLSLVRSNAEGVIGFLTDARRINVALTRARSKLVIIGDSATLGGYAFYRKLLAYCESIGAYQTAWELMPVAHGG